MFLCLARRSVSVAFFGFGLSCLDIAAAGSASPPAPAVQDQFTPVDPSSVRLKGLLGEYQDAIREYFVLYKDIVPKYLEPLENHDDNLWKAEHIGKWLDTASSVWKYSGDPKIRELMDEAVRRMAAAQNTNGWLGSYQESYRFYQVDWNSRPAFTNWDDKYHGWDLWCNYMSLEGLLKYHSVVKEDTLALRTAQRIGDLICETFGDGKQDIAKVPHDNGIGAMTSMLGLMHLYEWTGESQYLEFSHYVLRQFGRPGTMPIILSGTRGPETDRFPFTSDGAVLKHAESELILRGICEFYRMTGEQPMFQTCCNVFQAGYAPILPTMCLSGYTSPGPHIRVPRPVRQEVETCDIPPMLRWWVEMFRLTGEPQYLNAVEREVYNQLLCHRTLGGKVLEFMPAKHFEMVSGCSRRYSDLEPFNCCWSMGPVGLADLPGWTYFTSPNAILVNFYEPSSFSGTIHGVPVELELRSDYPLEGQIEIRVNPLEPTFFQLDLRIPPWAQNATTKINDRRTPDNPEGGKILKLGRRWKPGDRITIDLPMPGRATTPMKFSPGYCVIERGPLVLAMSRRFNESRDDWSNVAPEVRASGEVNLTRVHPKQAVNSEVAAWRAEGVSRADDDGNVARRKRAMILVPFKDAGLALEPYVAAFRLAKTVPELPVQHSR